MTTCIVHRSRRFDLPDLCTKYDNYQHARERLAVMKAAPKVFRRPIMLVRVIKWHDTPWED